MIKIDNQDYCYQFDDITANKLSFINYNYLDSYNLFHIKNED